mgnify:CR=1 FL=1
MELTHVEDCFKTLNHYQTPFKSTSMVTLIIRCIKVSSMNHLLTEDVTWDQCPEMQYLIKGNSGERINCKASANPKPNSKCFQVLLWQWPILWPFNSHLEQRIWISEQQPAVFDQLNWHRCQRACHGKWWRGFSNKRHGSANWKHLWKANYCSDLL